MSGFVRVLSSDQRLAEAVQAALGRTAPAASDGRTQSDATLIVFAPLRPDEHDSEGEISAAAALWRMIECERETRGSKRAFLDTTNDPARAARVASALGRIGMNDSIAARAISETLVTFDVSEPTAASVPLWIERAWRALGRLCEEPEHEEAAAVLAATFGGSRAAPAVLKRMLMTAQAALAAASRRQGSADGAVIRDLEQTRIELGDVRRRLFETETALEVQQALADRVPDEALARAERLNDAEEKIARLQKSQEDQRRFIAMIGERIAASEAEAERLGAELAVRNSELAHARAAAEEMALSQSVTQDALHQAQLRSADLERDTGAKSDRLLQLDELLRSREIELQQAQSQVSTLAKDVVAKAERLQRLDALLHDRAIVLRQTESRVSTLEQDAEAKDASLVQLSEALRERSGTLQSVLGDLAAREDELRSALAETERKEEECRVMTARLTKLDGNLAEVQRRVADREAALLTAERRLRVTESLRRDLNAALGQARMAAEDQATQAAALRAALDDATARAWPRSPLRRVLSRLLGGRLAGLVRRWSSLQGKGSHRPPTRG